MTDQTLYRFAFIKSASQGGYSTRILMQGEDFASQGIQYYESEMDEFQIVYTITREAITGDSITLSVDAQYGVGNPTTGIYDFASLSGSLTVDGSAAGFREDELPMVNGRSFGGDTRAKFYIQVGVANESVPLNSMQPCIILSARSQSAWSTWVQFGPGELDFTAPPTFTAIEKQKVILGTVNPVLSQAADDFLNPDPDIIGSGAITTITNQSEALLAEDAAYSFP